MKTNKYKMIFAALSALVSIQTNAQDFGGRNGGDPMELQFREVAMDIQQWIAKGGARALALPANVTIDNYQTQMMSVLNEGTVSFTNNTITVNGVEKACMNLPALKLIQCNVDRFKSTTESERYVLVHHEYAGLAGLETNTGAKSDYSISEQLTASLEKVTVLKLAVKSPSSSGSYRDQFIQAKGMTIQEMLNHIDPVDSAKDHAKWSCYSSDGKFYLWILGSPTKYGDLFDNIRGFNYRYNARIGTMVMDEHQAILKKTINGQIVMELSKQVSARKQARYPDHERSVYYPERFSEYYLCNAK